MVKKCSHRGANNAGTAPYEKIEEHLIDLLVAAFKQQPLGKWIKEEDLLESLPDLNKQEDGAFTISGMNTVLDEDDLNSIVIDALTRLEEEGYFIDVLYSDEYRLFERLAPGSKLDLSSLKEMEYRETDAWGVNIHKGFSLKGRELSEVTGSILEESTKSINLTNEQFMRLCEIVESANVCNWRADYQPEVYMVLDGTHWDFKMIFEGNKAFASHGSNAWPDGIEELYESIMGILVEG